ncbi:MAG: hypothetical protein FIA92_03840 [Chloroflexi bacterium]|nr:hypothetical protein [Chloroflexota bacterium]
MMAPRSSSCRQGGTLGGTSDRGERSMNRLGRRQFLIRTGALGGIVVAGGGLSSILAACGGTPAATATLGPTPPGTSPTPGQSAAPPVLTAPRIASASGLGAPWILRDMGPILYGEPYGLKMTKDNFISFDSGAVATQALVSGQADIVTGSYLSALSLVNQGLPFKVFMPYQKVDEVVLAARPPVASVQDLLTPSNLVAVDSPGGAASVALQAIFEANGIDVAVPTLTNAQLLESSGQRVSALTNGDVQAAVMRQFQFNAAKAEVPELEILANLYEDTPNYLALTLTASEAWLDANLDVATAVCQSMMAAARAFGESFEAYNEACQEGLENPPAEEVLRETWSLATEHGFWPTDGRITSAQHDFMASLGTKEELFEQAPSYEDTVDDRAMAAARASFGV